MGKIGTSVIIVSLGQNTLSGCELVHLPEYGSTLVPLLPSCARTSEQFFFIQERIVSKEIIKVLLYLPLST